MRSLFLFFPALSQVPWPLLVEGELTGRRMKTSCEEPKPSKTRAARPLRRDHRPLDRDCSTVTSTPKRHPRGPKHQRPATWRLQVRFGRGRIASAGMSIKPASQGPQGSGGPASAYSPSHSGLRAPPRPSSRALYYSKHRKVPPDGHSAPPPGAPRRRGPGLASLPLLAGGATECLAPLRACRRVAQTTLRVRLQRCVVGLRRPAALRLQQPTAGSTPKRTEYLAHDWACGLAMGPSQQHERLKLLDRVEGSKQ